MKEIDILKKIVNSQIYTELYGRKWTELYKNEILKCITDVEQKISSDSKIYNSNKQILDSFIQDTKIIIIESPLDKDTMESIRKILTLIYNWNKAFVNDREFETDIMLAIRLIDQTLTLAEYISVSREVIKRLKNLVYFQPPMFQLSKHYLKTLLDKYEDA